MKRIPQLAAIIALGTACAMPVMAQDSSTTTASPDTTAQTTTPSTDTMGAGPETMARDDDRDMGWIGLLGLAGLLGLRRKHHDHHDQGRMSTAR